MAFVPPAALGAVFKFENSGKKGKFTCVGRAPSVPRSDKRCRNPIAPHNQLAAKELTRVLSLHPDQRSHLQTQLQRVAGHALCGAYHQSQALSISQSWYEQILVQLQERDSATSRTPGPETRPLARSGAAARTESLSRVSAPSPEILASWIPPALAANLSNVTPANNVNYNVSTVDSEDDDAEVECRICRGPYQHPSRAPCGHVFCHECIITWLQESRTCPFDRRLLNEIQLLSLDENEHDPSGATEDEDELIMISEDSASHLISPTGDGHNSEERTLHEASELSTGENDPEVTATDEENLASIDEGNSATASPDERIITVGQDTSAEAEVTNEEEHIVLDGECARNETLIEVSSATSLERREPMHCGRFLCRGLGWATYHYRVLSDPLGTTWGRWGSIGFALLAWARLELVKGTVAGI